MWAVHFFGKKNLQFRTKVFKLFSLIANQNEWSCISHNLFNMNTFLIIFVYFSFAKFRSMKIDDWKKRLETAVNSIFVRPCAKPNEQKAFILDQVRD